MAKRTTEVLTWRAIHGASSTTPWSTVPWRSGPIGGRLNARGATRLEARSSARDLDIPSEATENQSLKGPSGTSQASTLQRSGGVETSKEVNPL